MNVFITGITGTLGSALADRLLAEDRPVFGCARNEEKLTAWRDARKKFVHEGLLTTFIGDFEQLADRYTEMGESLWAATTVYHCAAMKHVDMCERHVTE